MKKTDDYKEWLSRAKSNLTLAKDTKKNNYIYYEDLCFDAQQCAEKSFKALCIYNNIPFPKTHDIYYLIDILEKGGINIPSKIRIAGDLSDYSSETRYPGDYEEVDEKEYKRVIKIAEDVFNWVSKKINI